MTKLESVQKQLEIVQDQIALQKKQSDFYSAQLLDRQAALRVELAKLQPQDTPPAQGV